MWGRPWILGQISQGGSRIQVLSISTRHNPRGGRETKRDEESLHEELIVEMDLEAWAKHLISRDRRRIWSQ